MRAYLSAQAREYRVEIKENVPPSPFGGKLAGAATIGQKGTDSFQSLEKRRPHSWALFDQNIAKAMLEDLDLRKHLEEFIKVEAKPVLKDAFEELLGLHPSTPALVKRMSRTTRKFARAGGGVVLS